MSKSPWEVDIDALVADRQAFNEFVYTPLNEAMVELKRRREDKKLGDKISELLHNDIPPFLTGLPMRAVLFRQLATPNYEVRRFFHLADGLKDLEPLFWEYYEDKFTSNNHWKHSLGKIKFLMRIGKKQEEKTEHVTIVDFAKYDGDKISQVKTFWGQSLVSFHHELFNKTYKPINTESFYDISSWLHRHGDSAINYYVPVLMCFVLHGILFENFMLDAKEISFSKDIFLPAFIKVFQKTGHKPLIVALEPTDIEGDDFWLCHPSKSKAFVESKKISRASSFLLRGIKKYIKMIWT